MHDHDTTGKSNGTPERFPFGELHAEAMRDMPGGNGQRDAFLEGRPNVWGTLRRHLDDMKEKGASRLQFDRLLTTLHDEVDAWFGEPSETVKEVSMLDMSAECAENLSEVAAVDAVARFNDASALGALQRLQENALANMTTSRLQARVAAREIRTRSRKARA